MGRFVVLCLDISRAGRVTSDVVRCMGVTNFIGLGKYLVLKRGCFLAELGYRYSRSWNYNCAPRRIRGASDQLLDTQGEERGANCQAPKRADAAGSRR